MEALGINIVNIITYTILFLIVYSVINSKLVGAIMKMIDKRKEEIEKGLALTKSMEKKTKDFENEKVSIVNDIKSEAKNDVKETLAQAKVDSKKLIEAAQAEAQIIITKANETLKVERAKLQVEMESKVEEAVRKVLNKIYQDQKVEIDKKLIEKVVNELQ